LTSGGKIVHMDESYSLAEAMRCPHGREFYASSDGSPVFVLGCSECEDSQPSQNRITAMVA